jgi:type I restriction enzyme R subunit
MGFGPEFRLAEKPCIEGLVALGYGYLPPAETKETVKVAPEHLRDGNNESARDGSNQVLLREEFIESVQLINDVSADVARAVYQELIGQHDNEEWIKILRGNYSRTVPGKATKQTIRLIDFEHPVRNTFTITNQFRVKAEKTRIADIVVFVNGIPLVVIEAKSPLAYKDKSGEAFDQIKQYERDVPRLFYANLFNIVTNGVHTLYGTTGAPSAYWGAWRDPWPREAEDFATPLRQDLYSLLEPDRLLDLLAHFVVFEREDNQVIKKVCRYHQYRAVNKLVQRVVEGKHLRGLVWHTQGSGKSLTMVFAALKLKAHQTIQHPSLTNPNIMVLTDRTDLDDQISSTFGACGLPNPLQIKNIKKLHELVHNSTSGLTLLSTIFKLEGSRKPVPDSANWILLVDECHRTQEKDLGAYLRATFPDARFFGFTGTPIKKTDKDTYTNFGAPGEGYMDKYSIDDAVADGATVPVRYTSRKAEWQVDPAKLDIQFDQWFTDLPEEQLEKIKARGVTLSDLAKHQKRVELIAYDIWEHYRSHALPDGYKAQVVAIDREAVILYKRALDKVIAATLVQEGTFPKEALAEAEAMSACIYSGNQEDGKPSEDKYLAGIRTDLVLQLVDGQDEKEIKNAFKKSGQPPYFLIVCNKLLTGFDAPIESVMYLDNPLKEHNLLQAIARTNRVAGSTKQFGLIVDYIGVTKKLVEALASYRSEDVQSAMLDLDVNRQELKAAHAEVMKLIKGIPRHTQDLKAEYDALVQALGTEDVWFTFYRTGKTFIRAYEALSPDPAILDYQRDLKWVAGFLVYGALVFEKKEVLDFLDYSAKIRQILDEQLDVTGLRTLIKLRSITDPEFNDDFKTEGKAPDELKTAAIRKTAELKKTLAEKMAKEPERYGAFSEMVLELLLRFEMGQIEAADILKEYEKIVKGIKDEEGGHTGTSLNPKAYGVYKILEALKPPAEAVGESPGDYGKEGAGDGPSKLEQLASEIDGLYDSDQTAPPGWHMKDQLKKELRQAVRGIVHLAGLQELRTIPTRVEEYALKTYVKLS